MENLLTRTITAKWTVKFYAPIAWTITQQSVTAAVQESGVKMQRAMITPAFADNATTITIPVVKNVTHLFHNDDAYEYDDGYFCHECYQRIRKNAPIHEYGYKPKPIFYGDSNRYFGVELEIDGAGKDDEYAEKLLDIANMQGEHIYVKTDGSLDDGMEIVTHPM